VNFLTCVDILRTFLGKPHPAVAFRNALVESCLSLNLLKQALIRRPSVLGRRLDYLGTGLGDAASSVMDPFITVHFTTSALAAINAAGGKLGTY
jgi:hypothetical protein